MSVFDIPDDEVFGWRRQAACRGADTRLFFPEPRERPDAAMAFCRRCPVRNDCLAEHLHEQEGVFGGLTPDERLDLRRGRTTRRVRRRQGEPTDGSACGSTVGYSRHQTAGETPCVECKAAKAEYRRLIRARRRAA